MDWLKEVFWLEEEDICWVEEICWLDDICWVDEKADAWVEDCPEKLKLQGDAGGCKGMQGPLDFIFRALRLRPCDPSIGDWIVC